jgi:hypothetical protein
MIYNNFPLFKFFHTLPNNRVLLWPSAYGTPCIFISMLLSSRKFLPISHWFIPKSCDDPHKNAVRVICSPRHKLGAFSQFKILLNCVQTHTSHMQQKKLYYFLQPLFETFLAAISIQRYNCEKRQETNVGFQENCVTFVRF